MSSSNLAPRMEFAATDLLSEPPRPVLQLVTNSAHRSERDNRPRLSLEFRRILIRDSGFRLFRVY